jgi:hypothetical protein
MSVELITHQYLGAEHITVMCDTLGFDTSGGSKILATIHHGYGSDAPPITPEEENAAFTVAFTHNHRHSLRVIYGHGADAEKVNGVSPMFEEDVNQRKRSWESSPRAPLPLDQYGQIFVYINKYERGEPEKNTQKDKISKREQHKIVQEEFNVENRLFHLLKDQFPDDTIRPTSSGTKKWVRRLNAFFTHIDGQNEGKKVEYALRFAYSDSGLKRAREGRKKILEMRPNEWWGKRVIVLNGKPDQEEILADFLGQMANLQGKWTDFEKLQEFVRQFPDYPQQCFWSAMRKGFFQRRANLYAWINQQPVGEINLHYPAEVLQGVSPEGETTPEPAEIAPQAVLFDVAHPDTI